VNPSALVAWSAVLAVPLNAAAGWLLRRRGRGSFVVRMRPHYVLGYAALVLAALHIALVGKSMGAANAAGIWLATFAMGGLALQAFVGTNLQSPGAYRTLLRRWHLVLFFAIALLILGHVVLD
jgi:hypothetical protein